MQKWEYYVGGTDALERLSLERLGQEGWELVSVAFTYKSNQYAKAIFKRPLIESSHDKKE